LNIPYVSGPDVQALQMMMEDTGMVVTAEKFGIVMSEISVHILAQHKRSGARITNNYLIFVFIPGRRLHMSITSKRHM
jgi:hypothetical protein